MPDMCPPSPPSGLAQLNRLSPEGWLIGAVDYEGPFKRGEVELSIGACFERRVAEFGADLAVERGEERWTYAELNAAANRVAHALLNSRGNASEPVVVLVGREPAYFAALIGVLKSRKILVSLDPDDPPDRIAHIVADSGAGAIVATPATADLARRVAPAAAILTPSFLRDDGDPGDPASGAGPDDPALLVYTSGSTGRPKGVLQLHRNFLMTVFNIVRAFNLRPEDKLAHLAGASYIMALSSMFQTLLAGGSMLLCDPKNEPTTAIVEAIRRHRVTYIHCVPTLMRQIAQAASGAGAILDSMRVVRLAGEPLSVKDVELYRSAIPRECLIGNGYGATEMNVARAFLLDGSTILEGAHVPAGYAMEGVQIHLLNEAGEAAAPGEVGEIVLQSRHIAPGYWRRPEETAAAFHPAPDGGGERLYRTGDLGRLAPDGCLEHLGRRDFQVKIRGVRVECGEVEAALKDQPEIADAAVERREFAPGDERLVAYCVPAPGPAPVWSELRVRLAARLPPAMIPSAFVAMDAFPLTATGKLDRAALPAPDLARRPASGEVTPPSDDAEAALRDVWEGLLGVRPVGVLDNFFDLGGHSVLAARLMIEVERLFGRSLAVAEIVGAPTVRALARRAREGPGTALPEGVFDLQSGGDGPPAFVLAEHHGALLGWREALALLGGTRPIYGVAPSLIVDGRGRYRSIEAQAALCADLIRAVDPRGPRLLLGYCHGALIALEAGRLLAEMGEEPPEVVAIEASAINRRHRWIYSTLRKWDALLGRPPEATIPRYLRARASAIMARGALRYAGRLRSPRELASARARFAGIVRSVWPAPKSPAGANGTRHDAPNPPSTSEAARPARPAARHDGPTFDDYLTPTYLHFPRPYPGRLTLILAERTSLSREPPSEHVRLWRKLVSGGVEARILPGNHETILARPHVEGLAREIRVRLEA